MDKRKIAVEVVLELDTDESAAWWAGWIMGALEIPLMSYDSAEVLNVRVLKDPA